MRRLHYLHVCFRSRVIFRAHIWYLLYYCLFGVNYFFMLGLEMKACKPLQNDLKRCQRHRNDLSIWRSVLGCLSKTKKWGQTLDQKCIGTDLYGKMGCAKFSGFYSPRSRITFCTGVFIPNADGSLVLGKLTPVHNRRGDGGDKIQKLEFRVPIFTDSRPFGPSF